MNVYQLQAVAAAVVVGLWALALYIAVWRHK
jgi:hypothetical protein